MTSQYFSPKQFSTAEKPLQELIELNVKTIQSFSQFNPAELFNLGKPEQILEKSMDIFIQNGHKALDYMGNVFHLMEKNWTHMSENISTSTNQLIKQAGTSAKNSIEEAIDVGQRTSKKVVANLKSVTKKNVKQAQSVARKNMQDTAKNIKQGSKTVAANLKSAANAIGTKSKPKTTKSTEVKASTKKPEVKSTASKASVKKPEVKSMSSYVKETQNTINKMENKVPDIKQDNATTVKPANKETGSNINKDRLM